MKLLTILIFIFSFTSGHALETQTTFYTKNHVRLKKISQHPMTKANLVFIPGGPGMGAEYFENLTHALQKDYSIWSLDLPGNGNNPKQQATLYENWPLYLMEIFDHLENVVLIGHSFGGMLILLNPKLQEKAKAFILMSTLPKTIYDTKQKNYWDHPEVHKEIAKYIAAPSDEALKQLMINVAPFYFEPENMEEGVKALKATSYSHKAYDEMKKSLLKNYQATYIPTIPTLILSGDQDIATPISHFQKDQRFQKENIKIAVISRANHLPWINNLQGTIQPIKDFLKNLQ